MRVPISSRRSRRSICLETDILPSIAKYNEVVLCRLRSSRQSHYVALEEGV